MEPASKSPDLQFKPMAQRKYDIVVVGATGVTGGLITKHLSKNAPNIEWAISGRSEEKLNKLIDNLSAVPDIINKPDILILDVLNDAESKLRSVLGDTRVVVDVVGPYSYWGEKVLKPCVEAGTAWIDLNGEVPWAKEMIEKYQALAERTKAVIVPSCGYDCVPSDIGVYLLSKFAGPLGKVDTVVEEVVGLASFGTLSSLLAPYYTYPSEKILKPNGYLGNPYCLYPQDGEIPKSLPVQPTKVTFKRANSSFVYHAPLRHMGREGPKRRGGYLISLTPFEAINRPVVLRSYGLRSSIDEQGKRTHDSYGSKFQYREWLLLPAGPLGGILSMPAAYVVGNLFPYCLSLSPVRGILKFFFDKLFGPGYGPSSELQERGGFRWRFIGEALNHEPKDVRAVLQMEGRRDVGYGWTSVVLSETALYLVDKLRNGDGTVFQPRRDYGGETSDIVKSVVEEWAKRDGDDVVFRGKNSEQRKGGFWTTASFGMGLARRLLCSGYLDVEMKWVRDEEAADEDKKTI